ncbi:MAG: hypothetical protein JNL91_09365, partial [Candidatus Accumulibacter sp.]|nr:hypothetical protein [Accumulibacter sp.]
MKQPDDLSAYYGELLEGRYDCVDRIVLNGYFPLGQQGGAFRTWWQALTGSDATLDAIFQGLIDRTRRLLDVPILRTLFGRQQRPRWRADRSHGVARIVDQS